MRNESTAKLNAAIAQVHRGHASRGRRYPLDLRQRILAHVVSQRSQGVSMVSTARSLGVPYQTLLGWMQAEPKGFRSVAVKEPAAERETVLCLVTVQGHRVEGVSREDVAFLLQSLT